MDHGAGSAVVAASDEAVRSTGRVVHVRKLRVLLAVVMVASLVFSAAPGYAVNPPHQINSISFAPDGLHGFMAGANLSTNPANGFLSYTTDGGAIWHAYLIPGHLTSTVVAETAGTALASGGYDTTAFRTADGGKAWTATAGSYFTGNVGTEVGAMTLLAGGRVAFAGSNTGTPNGILAAISTSDDHGASWIRRVAGPIYPLPSDGSDAPSTNARFTAIDAEPSGSVAWAVGHETQPGATTQSPLIYKTGDAGLTWTSQAVPGSAALSAVTVISPTLAYAAGPNRMLFKTTDGASWVNTLIAKPSFTVSPDYYGIDATDATRIVLVGGSSTTGNGIVQWTKDGTTWTNYKEFPGTTLRSVVMKDATHWIAVGDNETIVRTNDGGVTWTDPAASRSLPNVVLNQPAGAQSVLSLTGTAGDAGVGVAKVEVTIKLDDGQYWNGSAWQVAQVWLPVTSTNAWATWGFSDALTPSANQQRVLTVTAKVTDGLGNASSASKTSTLGTGVLQSAMTLSVPAVSAYGAATLSGSLKTSAGSALSGKAVALQYSYDNKTWVTLGTVTTLSTGGFSKAIAPARRTYYHASFAATSVNGAIKATATTLPRVYLSTPSAPSTALHGHAFVSAGYLKPRHTAGTYPVLVQAYRYERLTSGAWAWVLRRTYSGKAANYSNYTKYTSSLALPYAGKWHIRAYHATDSLNAATSTSFRYLVVK